MDDLRKAAQAALDALESLFNCRADENRHRKCWLARADLRAALAQPDQPAADGPELPPEASPDAYRKYSAQQMFAFQASAGRGVLRLSDPSLKPDIAKLKEKLRSDPKFALATLQSAGIATATGKLTKRFKG